ncbi:acyl-CoA acyltransferase [Sulfurimonas sp.]|uniref:acyl-CoA acyltransferase n=1 Tax=Sulfurimonas sp. TaxID=2022749 RepID=UPI00260776A6|nr:acyl-CoA acyltransferase [Sulfurimonas sp.]
MSIKIRQATQNDSSFLAEMILQSSRAGKKSGLFDLLFTDSSDAQILEKLAKLTTTEAKSSCNYKNFLIADIDGNRVGTLCSYEPRIATKESFIKALDEIGCTKDVETTLDVFYSCSFEQNKSTLMFDFMEEVAGCIDVGILKALMQKSLLSARLKGYRVAQTIIEIGSLESELFYKKLGFKKTAQVECESYKETFGRAGLMLMSLEF